MLGTGAEPTLRRVEEFARAWQMGCWSVGGLPDDLGLRVMTFPGGREVLGISILATGCVGLSDRLDDSGLRLGVQAHECGHHILGIGTAALCHAHWRPQPDETLAWMAAGRLCVSIGQIAELDRGSVSSFEIAEANGVPPELVRVGRAVHHGLVGRADGGELDAAMRAWSTRMYRLVRPLL